MGYDKILKGNSQMAKNAFPEKFLGCIYIINDLYLSIGSLREVTGRFVCSIYMLNCLFSLYIRMFS